MAQCSIQILKLALIIICCTNLLMLTICVYFKQRSTGGNNIYGGEQVLSRKREKNDMRMRVLCT